MNGRDPSDRMDSSWAIAPRVKQFARAVRARRRAMRLTQVELSRLAGCGPDFVYDVEIGKPTLRLDKLLDLLHVLGLELVLDQGKDTLRVAQAVAPPEVAGTSTTESVERAPRAEGMPTKMRAKKKSARSRRT